MAPMGTLEPPLDYTIQDLSSLLSKPNQRIIVEKDIRKKIFEEYNPHLGPKTLGKRRELDQVIETLEKKSFEQPFFNPALYEKILEYFPPLRKMYLMMDETLSRLFLANVHFLIHHHKGEKRKSGESYVQHLLEVGAGYAHAELREGIPNDPILLDSMFRVMSVEQHDSIEGVLSKLVKDDKKIENPLIETVFFDPEDLLMYERLNVEDLNTSVRFATSVNEGINRSFLGLIHQELGLEGLDRFSTHLEDMYKERKLFTKLPGHNYPFYLSRQKNPHYWEEITKRNIEVVMGGKQPDQAQNNSSLKVFRKQGNYPRIIKSLAKGAWGADMSLSYFGEKGREEERTTRIQWYLTYFNSATGYKVSKKEMEEFKKKVRGKNIGKFSKLEKQHDLFTEYGGYERITRLQQKTNENWGEAAIFHGTTTHLNNMISDNITPSTQIILDKVAGLNGYTQKEQEFETYKLLLAVNRWFTFYFAGRDYHLQLQENLKK